MIREEVSMAHTAQKQKPKMFYATVQVTRVEQWCVEADSREEARDLMAAGQGHRFDPGDCLHAEVIKIEDC